MLCGECLAMGLLAGKDPCYTQKSSSGQKKEHGNTAYNAVSNLLLVHLFSVSVLFIVFKIGFK